VGDAEVSDLGYSSFGEENILGLKVAVNDSAVE